MSDWLKKKIAAEGSAGNNTHPSVEIDPSIDVSQFVLQFIVEAAGATPTVTYKYQVSADDPSVTDANSTWSDLNYVPFQDGTETVAAATRARTTVGSDTLIPFMGTKARQIFRKIRLVTTLNTNVTYRSELSGLDTTP